MSLSSRYLNRVWLAPLFWGLCMFAGCETAPETVEFGPVFYPEPPDQPRLQFLKSFSGPDDVGAEKASAFETFIVGEAEDEDKLNRPYGVALHNGKLYVCDVGIQQVAILDIVNKTFAYMPKDKRLVNPANIFIEPDGTKYIADVTGGAVFVYDNDDKLLRILGRNIPIGPADVLVRDQYCYVSDLRTNRVVVMNKMTGEQVMTMGEEGDEPGQFARISDIAMDAQRNVYATDRIAANIKKFDPTGNFIRTFGSLGTNIDLFARPKGIAIDKEQRIWVVDAAADVAKIYDAEGRLLLFFGLPGDEPGNMNLPAKIILDYDDVELFQRYAVEGAVLEFLVIVTNQYGYSKVNVYGFGQFPTVAELEGVGQVTDDTSDVTP